MYEGKPKVNFFSPSYEYHLIIQIRTDAVIRIQMLIIITYLYVPVYPLNNTSKWLQSYKRTFETI